MPPLRKRPDLDETREALRRHDEEMADEHEESSEPAEASEDAEEGADENGAG